MNDALEDMTNNAWEQGRQVGALQVKGKIYALLQQWKDDEATFPVDHPEPGTKYTAIVALSTLRLCAEELMEALEE